MGLLLWSLLGLLCNAQMLLTSPEFKENELIPGDFGCDIVTGEDRDPFRPSPPLRWFRPPVQTQSFVLLVDDMDNEGFVHWIVGNIPKETRKLGEGVCNLSPRISCALFQ
jgi:phosphatidylethanolamine-binding protein (PEBP) family uncharacterized protein